VIPRTQHSERGYTSQRKFAAWAGASILSSFDTYHKHLKITKQAWEENPKAMLTIKSF
jgi:actin-related protein